MKYYTVSRSRETPGKGAGKSFKVHAKGCRYLTGSATEVKNLSGRPLSEVKKNHDACNVCLGSERLEKQVKSGKSYERQDWKHTGAAKRRDKKRGKA